jgi:hypothetical protein
MKLLIENWRKFVKEVEQLDELDQANLDTLANPQTPLATYVATLKKYANDKSFNKIAQAGAVDGNPRDEKVSVDRTSIAAASLYATQAEIGFDDSLKDQMTNPSWKPVQKALGLDGTPIIMPSLDDPPPPILVFDGEFILDGHHRWSQVMMMNPTGIVSIDNITGGGLDSGEDALKAMQFAIATVANNVVTKPFEGANLMAATEEQVQQYVLENITDEVLQLLVKAEKIAKPDKQLAAAYVAGNLKTIKSRAGKFSREKAMPQAGKSGTSQDIVNHALQTGKVNYDAPKASDASGNAPQAKRQKDV